MNHWASLPRKIAFVIPTLRTGGAERVCTLLANHWAARGHQVTLLTFEDDRCDAFALAPEVERIIIGHSALTNTLWQTLKKNFARVRQVRRHLLQRNVDVAISFMSPANACLALAALGTHTSAVGTERTFPPAIPLGWLRERVRWALYGLLDHVVAQTSESADWLRQHTRAKHVSAIPNPVVLPLSAHQPILNPQDCLRAGNRLVLAYGRLSVEKQFDHLIHAFADASENKQGWQLAILGDGPMREQLLETAHRRGITERVSMPGTAGNIADWLQVASLYALTSSFEGYPNSLLEALASGVPAISYDCRTGPRELIIDGANGFLVTPNALATFTARLATLMDDQPMRRRFAVQARATAADHSLAQIAPQWESIFEGGSRLRLARQRNSGISKRP